jgi:hypothetical protein
MNKLYKIIFALTIISSINAQDKIQNINFIFANNGYGFGY